MKQGTLITKIIMFILLAAVVLYLSIYAVQSFINPFTTTIAYQDILNDSIEVTGVVVREEQLLSGSTGIMDILPDEGERVAAGETVAVMYQSQDALDRKETLQTLELERDQLEYALRNGGNLSDAAKLEQQIVTSILNLRTNIAAGDLSSLESDTMTLRTLVLQREFAYSASGDSAAVLTETISDLEKQISSLETQLSSSTTSVHAPCSGLFSGQADGLESTLTPASLENITAAQLKSLPIAASPADAVGKLITGDRWYFAAAVDSATAQRLLPGDVVTIAFSRDYTGEVDMTVERIGPEENAGCVLVLSSKRSLRDVTLLREQTVELIFNHYIGIRVPKRALHLETMTKTDLKTGETSQVQVLGVYTVLGSQAEFSPVDIVREGGDYYLVTPSEYAGQVDITFKDGAYSLTSPGSRDLGDRILRVGDDIIVTASHLYDGKVVLE